MQNSTRTSGTKIFMMHLGTRLGSISETSALGKSHHHSQVLFNQVKYWNPVTNLAIIRVGRDEFRLLWSCITFITHIRGRKVRPKVIYTAGTIRTCQREIVGVIRKWVINSQNLLEGCRKEGLAKAMIEEINNIVP